MRSRPASTCDWRAASGCTSCFRRSRPAAPSSRSGFPRPTAPDLDELERRGFFDKVPRADIDALVMRRANLLITGAGGAGKTTFLGALLGSAPPHERIVIIEDVAELRVAHPHVVSLQARQPNLEGAGGVGLDRLVRESLRMRPDRLVVGECRGVEVRELLAALNTGHDGGAGTLHANSLDDVPARLEALGAIAGLTTDAVGRQAVSAFDAVLHLVARSDRPASGRDRPARSRCGRPPRRRRAELAVSRRDDRTAIRGDRGDHLSTGDPPGCGGRAGIGVASPGCGRRVPRRGRSRVPRGVPDPTSTTTCRNASSPRRSPSRATDPPGLPSPRPGWSPRDSGAPLAPSLLRLAAVLRSFAQAQREVDLALAGPVATARIIMFLPAVGLVFALLLGIAVVPVLFGTPDRLGLPRRRHRLDRGRQCASNRRMVQAANRRTTTVGLRTDLMVIALSGGGSTADAVGLVDRSLMTAGLAVGDGPIEETLALSAAAGVPVIPLLEAAADQERRTELAGSLRRAAAAEHPSADPAGRCFLPAFRRARRAAYDARADLLHIPRRRLIVHGSPGVTASISTDGRGSTCSCRTSAIQEA